MFETAKNTHSESYRFLWLRTFHHPIAIRLELRSDGTGALTTKVVNGEAGFLRKNNHLTENVSRPLTREQIQTFLTKIKDLEFWALPNPVHDEAGVDGAQWIIEGVKDGKYHTEGPVRELGLMLALGIAQMNIPKDEIF